MKCFKINKLFQDNIVMCLEDEYIYIEKPNEKLYMINVIELRMLKQNNMHTSNDVVFFPVPHVL